MTGYTRQSSANMVSGNTMYASDFNNEFNAIQTAFDGINGHTHDGTTGNGPKINLSTSVTGVLPVANGGNGGINNFSATGAPTSSSDSNAGYQVGSLWIDTTNDIVYICVDSTVASAIWVRHQVYSLALASIAGLTTSANQTIYTTASNAYATTALTPFGRSLIDDVDAATSRTTLGLGSIATQNANAVAITGGNITGTTITGITDLAIADGGTGASDAATARTNLGTNNASNLNTGTVADALLPSTMSGKTFTGNIIISNTNPEVRYVRTGANQWRHIIDPANSSLVSQHSTDGFVSNFTNALTLYPAGNAEVNGSKVWTEGNDGSGSNLDADLLDGQQGSFYQNASNLNSGTISDSRLPGTQIGKTFTTDTEVQGALYVGGISGGGIELGKRNGTSGPAFIDFHTSATVVDYNARILAVGDTGNGGGVLDFVCGPLRHNGQEIWDNTNLPIASQAEAQAGTETGVRAFSPLRVAQAIAALTTPFISSQQVITNGGQIVIAHGLGVTPNNVVGTLVCTTAENGYSVGDQVVQPLIALFASSNYGATAVVDSTNITIRVASSGFAQTAKNSGTVVGFTSANWRLVVKAYR